VSNTNDVNFDVLAEYNPLPAGNAPKKPAESAAKGASAAPRAKHAAPPHPATTAPSLLPRTGRKGGTP
jgi:hypothetical protein